MLEQPLRGGQMDQASAYHHSHNPHHPHHPHHPRPRTTSSGAFSHHHQAPATGQTPFSPYPQNPPNPSMARQSHPTNTFSSSSSIPSPATYRNSSSLDLRRSTSSRSFGQPQLSGYVALLRRQKATVWCDHAQCEDPRLAAQQRAAKMRANLEVSGGVAPYGSVSSASGRTSTGISATGKVAAKIRHHGKTPIVGYAGENHVGVGGVPMRLSATEVEAESSEDEDAHYPSRSQHHRAGSSGRSSVGSSSRRSHVPHRISGGPMGQAGQAGHAGHAGHAGQAGRRVGPGDTPEGAANLMEVMDGPQTLVMDDAASGRTMSAASGRSSFERGDSVGELGAPTRLASKSMMHSAIAREKSVKGVDDLRRRGSVDDRTSSLVSGRLFIANPD